MRDYIPHLQVSLLKASPPLWELALNCTIPTLGLLASTYGDETPVEWLKIQIGTLNDFASVGTKINPAQLHELAVLFVAQHPYINAAEVCYFIARFKGGIYGRFYGAIDPMKITTALQDYLRERRESIDMHERKERNRQHRENLEAQRMISSSYAEYLALKARAEAGDKEAQALLSPPGIPKPTG